MDVNFLVSTVFSGLSALVIEDVTDGGDMVAITARTREDAVPCPVCETPTAKVHGYHGRTVADVPVDARQVVVRLRVRRLVCPVLGCRRQTFREQIPELLERHQRRTVRLAEQISEVARELCGRATARLAGLPAMPVSRSTALLPADLDEDLDAVGRPVHPIPPHCRVTGTQPAVGAGAHQGTGDVRQAQAEGIAFLIGDELE